MKRIAVIVIALSLAATASAQLIVGNDQSGSATIWNIDPAGVNPPQALYSSSSSDAKPWGMAYNHDTNTLFWNNGSKLYSSPMGATLTPTELGTMTYNSSTVNFVGLGYHNGKLYGTRNISTEAVYEIDPKSLDAKLVYQYNSSYDFGGLDFDAVNGSLYGLSDSAPSGETAGLYEIDYVGQSTAFKAAYPSGETDIDGLAMYDGLAYYVTDGPISSQPFFYIYEAASGKQVGTIPSPFTGSGTFAAAAFVPEPASILLLGLGLLGLRRR